MGKFARLLAFVASLAAATAARGDAELLYWLVSPDSLEGTGFENFVSAYLMADDGSGGAFALGGSSGDAAVNRYAAETAGGSSSISQKSFAIAEEDVSTWAAYSFYVELVNGDGATLSRGEWSYTDLRAAGYIIQETDVGAIARMIAAGGGADFGSAVPEPSGGLLFAVGAALLALRRGRGGV